jgi:hypothetical protein
MSDTYRTESRTEMRIDGLQDKLAIVSASVARLEGQMTMLIEQNRKILDQLDAQGHGGQSLSSTLLSWIVLFLFVGAAVITASVYLGAYR